MKRFAFGESLSRIGDFVMTSKPTALPLMLVLATALFVGACDSDSPTAPSQAPAPPPPASTTNANFAISITASPSVFDLNEIVETGDSQATLLVTARRLDNNQPVPSGSTVVLTTSIGTLSNQSGTSAGTSIPVAFGTGGQATAFLDLPVRVLQAVVQARIQNSVAQTTIQIGEELTDPLFIQSVSPNSGPPSGGTTVSISGSGFEDPIRVLFGALPGVVVSSSAGLIRAQTPSIDLPVGEILTVAVSVTTNVNDPTATSQTDSLANAFTYARAGQTDLPRIFSLTPTSGPNEGGTQVTIFGEGFANEVQVFFGTQALIEANVLSVSPTQLVVQTPSATGPNAINQNAIVNVRVVNVASGAVTELPLAFQYGGGNSNSLFISAAGPGQGVYLGGTIVQIFGQGFDEPVAVEFGGVGQQEISVTGTEIVARSVPVEIINCNRPAGPFRVVNIETGEAADSNIDFTYLPIEPAIFGLSPSSIIVDVDTREFVTSGGMPIPAPTIVLNGFGLDRDTFVPRITFGTGQDAISAAFVDITELDTANFDPLFGIGRTLTFELPPFVGTFSTETCTTANDTSGERFLPTSVDVNIENLPTGCEDTLLNGFTYVPSDQSCRETDSTDTTVAPVASFTFADGGGLTVNFTDSSANTPTSWSWVFGDGSSPSTEQNPMHTYAVAGTYMVTLTATNSAGSDDVTIDVTVPVP